MGQITIRDITPEVEKKIRRISKDTGKSINLVIQEIIYQHAGFKCGIDEIIDIIVKSETILISPIVLGELIFGSPRTPWNMVPN